MAGGKVQFSEGGGERVLLLVPYGGVVARCAHGAGLFRCFRGFYPVERPTKTTLAGVPKCLWMITKGLWVISGVSFCLAGLFLLLPGGSNGFHTSKCP